MAFQYLPADGFNTGRLYQADGQRISYVCNAEGVIRFKDHSRMIDGVCRQPVRMDIWNRMSPITRAAAVMSRYDHCEYDYDREGIAQRLQADAWPAMRCTNN